jgi:hypothetical protein
MGAGREDVFSIPGSMRFPLTLQLLASLVRGIGFSVAISAVGATARGRPPRDVAALPDARRRALLLTRLRAMREAGTDVSACLHFLRRRGLRAGVAQGLLIDLERKQVADCERPLRESWNGYAFRYPGNWRIRPLVAEAGGEAGISIRGLGSALLMLVRADPAGAGYAALAAAQEDRIRHPQRTPVSSWGALCGRGVLLSGPHARLNLLVEVEVFRPRDVPIPFYLVQFHAVEEEQWVRPGFELVGSTFAVVGP